MIEVVGISETSANFYRIVRQAIPEDSHLHAHRLENPKSHISEFFDGLLNSIYDTFMYKEHHLRFSFALKYTRGSWRWMGSVSIVNSPVGWKTRVRLPADHVCSLATTFTPTLRPTRPLCNAHLVRRPRREANHSRPSDAAITIVWMCTATPGCVCMACAGVSSVSAVYRTESARQPDGSVFRSWFSPIYLFLLLMLTSV
jgi:hypothetical protein